jgi:hypothetical protein
LHLVDKKGTGIFLQKKLGVSLGQIPDSHIIQTYIIEFMPFGKMQQKSRFADLTRAAKVQDLKRFMNF